MTDQLPPAAGARSLVQRITDKYGELSAGHRAVADIILSSPHQAALMTLEDMAQSCGVSKATANRLAGKLGLSGYPELKSLLRAELQEALAPTQDLLDTVRVQNFSLTAPWTQSFREDLERIRTVRAVGGDAAFAQSADLLGKARRVFVVGFGTYAFIAQYAAYCLSSLRDNCHAVTHASGIEGTVRQLINADSEDVALQLAFARYTLQGIQVAKMLREKGVPLVCITDSTSNGPGAVATTCFLVERKPGFVVTAGGAGCMAVVDALVRGTAAALGTDLLEERSGQITAWIGDAITPF